MRKIKSIEVPNGEESTFFTTDKKLVILESCKVDSIKENINEIGIGQYGPVTMLVYTGYRNDKPVFEISANNNTILTFWE